MPVKFLVLRCFLFLGCIVGGIVGCASSSEVHHYNLQVLSEPKSSNLNFDSNVVLGVGPVIFPDMFHTPAIITTELPHGVMMSDKHFWAGNLNNMLIHVIAGNLSSLLNSSSVWPFPWEMVNEMPEFQVQMVVEKFSGPLEGPVHLQMRWSLAGDYGKQELLSDRRECKKEPSKAKYGQYVTAINECLNEFSEIMASMISASVSMVNLYSSS